MVNLSEIRDSLKIITFLENRISKLNERLHSIEARAGALLVKYEKESFDVLQIQRETLSSFILKVFGRFDARLEKEMREEIEAKAEYDKVVSDLEEIKQTKQECELRLSALRQQEREYSRELEKRREHIQQRLSETSGQHYKQYEDEIDALVSQIIEIDQALKAAARAKATAYNIIDSLKSAEGWATHDIFIGRSIVSHATKYSHIDAAESGFNILASQITSLRKELNDVEGLSATDLKQISTVHRTVNFWFDFLFHGITVRTQIRDNLDQVYGLVGALNKVETMLKKQSGEINLRMDDIKRKQEDLLVAL